MAGKTTITVKILGDARNFVSAVDKSESKLGGFIALGARVGTGLVAAGVAAGGALLKIGGDVDDAYDRIIIGTGATGAALDELNESFRNVVATVPTDMGSASVAIADLNTRLGLTGEPLEAVATQFLEVSRLTKTDLPTNIRTVSRAFGDWGIDDHAGALDRFFVASQATGATIDNLASQAVQFGAPLRQLGFSFDESVAMLGKFEQEGVNTELVLGSMRVALGRMARAGEEPIETFHRVTDEIRNAGDAGKANTLALELFGARAGPDMAAAIREGRFEIDELVTTLAGADGAILDTAERTADWRQGLQLLKNRALLALEPVAQQVFDKVGEAVAAVTPHFERFVGWVQKHWPTVQQVISRVAEWYVRDWLPIVRSVTERILRVFAGAVGWVRKNWPQIRATVEQVVSWIGENVVPVVARVVEGVVAAFRSVSVWVEENWPQIRSTIAGVVSWIGENVVPVVREVVDFVVAKFGEVVSWVREQWPQIQRTVETVMDRVRARIAVVTAVVAKLWDVFGERIMMAVRIAFDTIKGVIDGVMNVVKGIIETVMAVINGDWGRAWEGIKRIFSGVWTTIRAVLSNAVNNLKNVVGGGVDAVVATVTGLPGRLLETVTAIFNAGKKLGGAILDGIKDALSATFGFAADVGKAVLDAVKRVINTYVIDKINRALEFTIPLPFGASVSVNPPDIPRLHSGGWIPGPGVGARGEVPIIAQTGEYVLSRADVADILRGRQAPLVGEMYVSDGRDVFEELRALQVLDGLAA